MNDLDRMLERWTSAGLIRADQARAIRAAESRDEPPSRAIPVLAEVLAYIGAILSISAVVFIASQVWSDLASGAQLGLIALATGVLWTGGWWMREGNNPVRQRLVTVLWFLSAGGIGWLADVAATDLWDIGDGYGLIIGLTLSLTGDFSTATAGPRCSRSLWPAAWRLSAGGSPTSPGATTGLGCCFG